MTSYPELGAHGRLGNQLWEIASTIGIADKLGCWAEFNHWDYEPYFNVPPQRFMDNPQGEPSWNYATSLPESERPYLQDFSLWSHVQDSVRFWFQPSELTIRQLEEFGWFRLISHPVAVHIRRDERVEKYADTHPTPPWDYYENAIDLIKRTVEQPTFCVFSDDIAWCKENLPQEFLFIEGYPRLQDAYQTEGEPEWRDHLDLFLMSACKHHIIANSTFSWWGAFLSGNPQPIYPAVWYGPTMDHINWRLQIPLGWTEVGW